MIAYLKTTGHLIQSQMHRFPARSSRMMSSSFEANFIELGWREDTKQSMTKITNILSEELRTMKNYKKENSAWTSGFEAIENIANSRRRHLFRPQFVLLGYSGAMDDREVLKNIPDPVATFAAGVEMEHLFMLVHDDLMDKTTFRRGEPTLLLALSQNNDFKKMQSEISHLATLLGDLLFARSSRLLLRGGYESGKGGISAVETILDAAENAGAAQFEEIAGWISPLHGEDSDIVQNLVNDKVGLSGFAAPLIAGTRLAQERAGTSSAKQKELEKMCKDYGLIVGGIFHGIMSIMNLIQPTTESGKDQLEAFQSKRVTLPLLILDKSMKEAGDSSLQELLGSERTYSQRVQIYDLLQMHEVVEKCFEFVLKRFEDGRKLADQVETTEWQELSRGFHIVLNGLDNYMSEAKATFKATEKKQAQRT